MSIFDKLKKNFGSTAGAQSGQDCMNNASLAISAGEEPTIYDVHTPQGRHAYLELGEQIRSAGYTWMTDFYPELTREQVEALGGVDITSQLLSQALNPEIDVYGYHRVLDKLEKQIPDIKKRVMQYLAKRR
ncbi:MAG: hypothetical protein DPW11_02910 [bacterium]|nr:hypothetical protein [Candidatus Microgenomates bacterium CPR3]MCQ3944700.1 hypothetical protein [bacterium]RIK50834.1 MAG: hypothetical protein DCC61_04360 [Candidatus Microgenomates bacterium]